MRRPRLGGLGPAFLQLWAATGATAVGAQVTVIALPLFAVITLHVSAFQAGLLGTAQWLPFLVIALPLGVLVDRMRRRPLLVAAETGRAVVLLGLVVLAWAALLPFTALLVLALLLGCCTVLYEVTYQSYLPTLVPASHLDIANSRLQSTEAVALIAGPGIAGALVQVVGTISALCTQVVTSGLSAVLLARIRHAEPSPSRAHQMPFFRALRDGLAFLAGDRVLIGLVGFSAIYNPFEQWIMVLFTIDAIRRLQLNAAELGAVFAIGAMGAMAGALAAPSVARRFGSLPTTLCCAAVESVVLLVLPLVSSDFGVVALIALLGTAFFINSAATALSSVVLLTVRQIRIPNALRGRVNATTRTISYGSIALGAFLGGLAGQLFGVHTGLTIGCIGVLATIAWTFAWGLPLIRGGVRIDEPAPASAAAS